MAKTQDDREPIDRATDVADEEFEDDELEDEDEDEDEKVDEEDVR